MGILSATRTSVKCRGPYYGVLLLGLLLVSCVQERAPEPDSFVVGIENAPATLDPRLATDAYSAKISHLIYAGLFQYNEQLELIPDLLESYHIVSPTEFHFSLRPNLKFHHGKTLAAEDVAWTLNSIRRRKVISPHYGTMQKIAGIEVTDELHFIITLKDPYAPFLSALSIGILPADGSENGAGPFKLKEWIPETEVTLERFLDYHGIVATPREIRFRIIREDNLRTLELARGRIDLVQNAVPAALIPYVRGKSKLAIDSAPGINYNYLGFNFADPILQKLEVRQAIAHALDRTQIIRYKLRGFARPATGVLAPLHWAYTEPETQYSYDPQQARSLLDAAGYPDPDGPGPKKRFQIYYKTSSQRERVGLARLIAHYLNEVGVEVIVTPYEWGTFFRDIGNGNFQMYSLSWVGVTEPDIYYDIFHSLQFPPEGRNRNRFSDPIMDQLTAAGRTTLDRKERIEIYWEAQKLAARELPYVSLWYEDNVVVRRRDVKGYTIYPNASFMGLINVYREP